MNVYLFGSQAKAGNVAGTGGEEGEVKIKRKDGQTFVIRPEKRVGSPLDVEGINLGITTAEIVQFIHEGRRTIYEPMAQADSPAT